MQQLGLERFEQHDNGDMLLERSLHASPVRMPGYVNSPPSMRLLGGMGSLIDALPPRLIVERIAFTPALPASLAQTWQATVT